jgi:hypothetical protein
VLASVHADGAGLVFAIVIAAAALGAARLWPARRAVNGDTRFTWILYGPMWLGGAAVIWAGARIASVNVPVCLVIVISGAITLVLFARAVRAIIQPSVADGRS